MKKAFLKIGALTSALSMTVSSALAAEGVVTIPETVDVGAYITEGITSLGAIVAVAVGGYACFFLVRRALRWFSTAIK